MVCCDVIWVLFSYSGLIAVFGGVLAAGRELEPKHEGRKRRDLFSSVMGCVVVLFERAPR